MIMANERVQLTRNTGTESTPVWQKWFAITVADAVKMSDKDGETKTIVDYVNQKIGDLIGGAPETFDTLKEIADYIEQHKEVVDAINAAIGNKVDKVTGKSLSTNDYTTAEKTKLAGIASNANNYVHPSNHPATIITEDVTHRFVTDTEKSTWNGKAGSAVATALANGLMSKEDKTKLDGVSANANNYVHPETDGNKHVPPTSTTNSGKALIAGTTAGAFSWQALTKSMVGLNNVDNTSDLSKPISSAVQSALDGKAANSVVTTSRPGLMASEDKNKLDGISAGANNYVHPASHSANMITQDATHRFITDAEKSAWNGKANVIFADQLPTTAPAGTLCFLIQ